MIVNICQVLIISYLLIAAYIDHKTQYVYRLGSIFFICVSSILFLVSAGSDPSVIGGKIVSIVIASILVILQGKANMMGWGDVLTYIGTFIYLASWKYEHLSLELMAIYMMLANLLFLLFNIRKIDWKQKRLKEEGAFLPGMVGGMLIMLFIWG